ncbi:MAG: hypothetical protein ACOYL8_04200 [Patescibacteria group bacterium]
MNKKNIKITNDTYYWPLWFSKSLNRFEQNKIKVIIKKIQTAQLCIWEALNIYDDFFDGAGEISRLPQANVYLRQYLEIHYDLNLNKDYYKLLQITFDKLDRVNQAEISSKKLEIKNGLVILPKNISPNVDLKNLPNKSLVLALGSIAILSYLGYKIKDKKVKSTINFYKYALSAKQLADDSHDWLEDLNSGLITLANAPVLEAARRRGIKLNTKNEPLKAYLLFSEVASPIIIENLLSLCKLAKLEFKKLNFRKNDILSNKLIKPIELACNKAVKFRALLVEN